MTKLQRYVSNELAHFVGRGTAERAQYDLLVRILRSGWLTHPPHNPNTSGNLIVTGGAKLSTNEMYSPQIVCFCDIPVEDLHIHTAKYSRFGLSLSKTFVGARGGAPVHYLPRSARGHGALGDDVSMADLFDRMLPEYHSLMARFADLLMKDASSPGVPPDHTRLHRLRQFLDFRVFSYVKFFDDTLEDDDPENFYMEREWRVVGNVKFSLADVRRVFVPSAFGQDLRTDIPDFCGQVTFVD